MARSLTSIDLLFLLHTCRNKELCPSPSFATRRRRLFSKFIVTLRATHPSPSISVHDFLPHGSLYQERTMIIAKVFANGCISWDITLCSAIHQSKLRVPPDPRVCRVERYLVTRLASHLSSHVDLTSGQLCVDV